MIRKETVDIIIRADPEGRPAECKVILKQILWSETGEYDPDEAFPEMIFERYSAQSRPWHHTGRRYPLRCIPFERNSLLRL